MPPIPFAKISLAVVSQAFGRSAFSWSLENSATFHEVPAGTWRGGRSEYPFAADRRCRYMPSSAPRPAQVPPASRGCRLRNKKDAYRYFSSCQRTKFSSGSHQLVPDLTAHHQGRKPGLPNYFASHFVSQPPLSDRTSTRFFFLWSLLLSFTFLAPHPQGSILFLPFFLSAQTDLLSFHFFFCLVGLFFFLTWAPHLRPECDCIEILSKRQR